jgi:hypothetical protein
MFKIYQQQFLADVRVRHAHTARHRGIICEHAPRAGAMKLGIGQIEKRTKWLGGKPAYAK